MVHYLALFYNEICKVFALTIQPVNLKWQYNLRQTYMWWNTDDIRFIGTWLRLTAELIKKSRTIPPPPQKKY